MVREEQLQEALNDLGLYDLNYAPQWLEEMINVLLDAGWKKVDPFGDEEEDEEEDGVL